MKKIMNSPKNYVIEMLQGIVAVNEDKLKLMAEEMIIKRTNAKKNKVSLVSGGGSGHEPAHAGFVGYGMLDAAVAGNIFASPSAFQILKAIEEVDNGMGVLLIVKNYSGDVMNFEIAKEMAEEKGIRVETVIVNDDIAISSDEDNEGRRGIAGTIFVHKIAGAMAEKGAAIEEVKRVAIKTIDNIGSIGMAIKPCILPESDTYHFDLEDNEMEIGVGIHGEPGLLKKSLEPANEIARELCESIFKDKQIENGENIAIIINGLGSTPISELYIFTDSVMNFLKSKDLSIKKTLVGNFMTSLDMEGISLTILRLDNELEDLLLEKQEVIAFNMF